MIDNLKPLTFDHLMRWILREQKKSGSIFGVRDFYQANPFKTLPIGDDRIETPFGPAAGPHTQYAQSIIAAYAAGCRFFELRTVCPRQIRQDPEISIGSEAINVEGAGNLTFKEAYEEYCKAWVALKVLSVEYKMGGMDNFVFNISAGYTFEDFKSPEMTEFLDKMYDARKSEIFGECIEYLRDNIGMFQNFTEEDIDDISPMISHGISVCTPIDCSINELENIARYLMVNRKFDIGIKLNSAMLGYEYCRNTLDSMGYFDIEISRETIERCVRYYDVVPIINKLMGLANKEGRLFGVKLTGAFPIVGGIERSKELKLSGKAIFPLSVALAAKLSDDFDGRLRVAFSGGADANNVEDIYEAGVWPITMNTTILKPGGFNRFKQISYTFNEWSYNERFGTRTGLLRRMAERARENNHYTKPVKSDIFKRKAGRIPMVNCFIAPCVEGCPIGQDITGYLNLIDEERYTEALRTIIDKNPLPFITGSICTHECMSNCTRIFYEKSVKIRDAKLIAAQNGYEGVIDELHPRPPVGRKLNIAIVGGGPCGMSSAFFLAREGHKVTIYDCFEKPGGVVRYVIPDFRIPTDRVDKDFGFLKALNVDFRGNHKIEKLEELKEYDKTILAMGVSNVNKLDIPGIKCITADEFMFKYKERKGKLSIGANVVIIGGSNIAVDTARAVKRVKGLRNVYIVYRRNRRFMPANDEELQLALSEGIELLECMMPFEYNDGYLKCHVTRIPEDAVDRYAPVYDTDEVISVPADDVITAIGVRVDTTFYRENGINMYESGLPVINEDTLESNIPGVYIGGECRIGSATVVEAIADARKIADAILKEFENMVADDSEGRPGLGYGGISYYNVNRPDDRRNAGRRVSDTRLSGLYSRKGILREPHYRNDGGRCLDCSRLCENCVDVCPNRANVEIKVPGNPVPQVLHIDRLCNECGNCDTFCPYEGAPYKEKFTLYDNVEDFEAGTNEGIVFTHDGSAFTIRIKKKDGLKVFRVSRIEAAEFNGIGTDLCNLIATIYQDYKYLII